MDPALALGIIQAGEGLPGFFGAFKGMRKDAKSSAGAGAAYLAYHDATSRALAYLTLIVSIGVPPRIEGGIWSWPISFRAHRHFTDEVMRMTTTFGQMVMVGDYGVTKAGYEFGLKFIECTRDLPRVGRRIAMTDEYQQRINAAQEAMRTFILAAREDMGVPGPTESIDTK